MNPLNNHAQSNVAMLLKAAEQSDRTKSDIAFALLGKQQEAAKQSGEAINELLTQAANLQSQLAANRIDVRA